MTGSPVFQFGPRAPSQVGYDLAAEARERRWEDWRHDTAVHVRDEAADAEARPLPLPDWVLTALAEQGDLRRNGVSAVDRWADLPDGVSRREWWEARLRFLDGEIAAVTEVLG